MVHLLQAQHAIIEMLNTGKDVEQDGEQDPQKLCHNLLSRPIFHDFVTHAPTLSVLEYVFGGRNFKLSEVTANCLLPGASAQYPHMDYPYCLEEYCSQSNDNDNFLNCQVLLMLDDFTVDNGATAVLPGSQHIISQPEEIKFFKNCVRVTAPAGSLLFHSGRLHHCAMENESQYARTGILMQYVDASVPIRADADCSMD